MIWLASSPSSLTSGRHQSSSPRCSTHKADSARTRHRHRTARQQPVSQRVRGQLAATLAPRSTTPVALAPTRWSRRQASEAIATDASFATCFVLAGASTSRSFWICQVAAVLFLTAASGRSVNSRSINIRRSRSSTTSTSARRALGESLDVGIRRIPRGEYDHTPCRHEGARGVGSARVAREPIGQATRRAYLSHWPTAHHSDKPLNER